MLFKKSMTASSRGGSFDYLEPGAWYFDSACQTMRPREVIDAETEYYRAYNACGGRVKYRWGEKVDAAVEETRSRLLETTGKHERDYVVAFTLNTTYGINLVLHQLAEGSFKKIVTSDIEHNSVMVPSMAWSARRGSPLSILPRGADGSLEYTSSDLENAVVIANSVSNIDGRRLVNAQRLAKDAHEHGGVLLLDAAQGFAHDRETLAHTDFDAAFCSGHKAYGPSLGFVIIRRTLLRSLDPLFLGGGTVADVDASTYTLLDEPHAILEPGLQNWGGIVGMGAALRWLKTQDPSHETRLAQHLWDGLTTLGRITPLNTTASPIVSFHIDGLDAHKLAVLLGEQNIMCRSGHFCCHRYLHHQLKLPPLLRISLGLHNTKDDVDTLITVLRSILSVF